MIDEYEWISTKERLPENDAYVLVTNGFEYRVMDYHKREEAFYYPSVGGKSHNVLFWMPLPPLPEIWEIWEAQKNE